MNFRKQILFASLALTCAASTVDAQLIFYRSSARSAARSGNHVASVGNSYLGAALNTTAGVSYYSGYGTETANANFAMSGVGKLFNYSKEIAYLGATATSTINSAGQSRTATATLRILGFNWGSSSTSGHAFSKYSYNLKLFPFDPSLDVPLGPVTLNIKGNCGVNATAAGGTALPAGEPRVALSANVSTGAFANAWVGFSIPGFGLGVEVKGDIGVQQLGMYGGANPRTGLSGDAYYTLTPISIKLVGKAWALFWSTSKTLASWTAGQIGKVLFQI